MLGNQKLQSYLNTFSHDMLDKSGTKIKSEFNI